MHQPSKIEYDAVLYFFTAAATHQEVRFHDDGTDSKETSESNKSSAPGDCLVQSKQVSTIVCLDVLNQQCNYLKAMIVPN